MLKTQKKIMSALQNHGQTMLIWGLLVLVIAVVSMAIPPLQSPDEPDHIRRAHLLSHGQILLENQDHWQSGGLIDTSLTAYLVPYHTLGFPENKNKRLTAQEMHDASQIKWSNNKKSYIQMPGTGYYFPLIYIPQAIGLGLGELTNQTIQTSYRLARFFTLIVTVTILWWAWRISGIPPLVAALLVLPMSIYQLASASIDGLSNALVVLVAALFLSIWREKSEAALLRTKFFLLCFVIFIIVTTRYHLVGLLGLPLVLTTQRDHWLRSFLCMAVVISLTVWITWVLNSIIDHRVSMAASKNEIALHYIMHPIEFFKAIFRSLSNPDLRRLYYESFLGRLAMLDVPYSKNQYLALVVCLLISIIGSINTIGFRQDWPARCALLIAGIVSVPLAFAAMILTWTPHPADVVYGIQGRYFIAPAIAIGFGLYTYHQQILSIRSVAAWCSVAMIGIFSVLTIPFMIALRFYVQAF